MDEADLHEDLGRRIGRTAVLGAEAEDDADAAALVHLVYTERVGDKLPIIDDLTCKLTFSFRVPDVKCRR